ncbi:MAG: hypothetical protein V4687_18825 [Bacteroidota bacterium]
MKKIFLFLLFIIKVTSSVNAQEPDKTWWSFSYPENKSLDSGSLNLRYLNERFAGENGFIKLSNDGNSFVNGKGKEIRFWSCNGGSLAAEFSDAKLDTLAKFLAKIGVNQIRYHAAINPRGKNTKITDVDTNEVKNIWRCVAAMKGQGIYTVISPFWPHNGHMGGWVPNEWGIDGYSGKDDLWAVLFFDEKLKAGYKAWVKYLYTTPNPYTGIALKDEPAISIIQIENEDAVFFWTISAIKPALAKLIGTQFSTWLKQKYGPDKAIRDTVDLINIYELTIPARNNNAQLIKDQVEFYAFKQRAFYQEMTDYYRKELACKQLINGNNWRTASQSRLLDLERWTNSAADVIAANKYFDPQHTGPNNGWRIDPGDFYGSPSALKNPQDLPTNIKHVSGHPMIITESAWNLPNKYQTEGPLLIAAYGGLTGLDAFFWFAPTAATYAKNPYYDFLNINGQHPMNRWTTSTPGEMGMFPANALMHRLGYIKEANAVKETRTMESLLNREVPQIFEEQSFDPNRDFILSKAENEGKRELSPLTFLTGSITTSYGTSTNTLSTTKGLEKLIDASQQKITSVTKEQQLDYKSGIFILNTSKAKAVSGFLNQQKSFNLNSVSIESENEYATIQLVSMDGKDINISKKMLLQVGTLFRPTGWKEEPTVSGKNEKKVSGFKITNTGKMPWLGMPAIGNIVINNKNINKATQLDAAGYAIKKLNLEKTSKGVKLHLPADALYILIE